MSQQYPRVGSKTKPRGIKKQKPCRVCGVLSNGYVEIEINPFRGDDEIISVCGACQSGRGASERIMKACLGGGNEAA